LRGFFLLDHQYQYAASSKTTAQGIPNRVTHSFYYRVGPEYLLPSARLAVYFWQRQFGGDAIVKEVSNSKITTQEVADILGIDISALRRMMRQGKIAAPPILFDSKTNSTGRMWSEDEVEAGRAALKAASANS
jgi:hypothetical protein